MTRFADSQTESRISGIESELSRKAESHEISTLRSDVARLEHSLREASSTIDGLRSRCERLEEAVRELNPGLNI